VVEWRRLYLISQPYTLSAQQVREGHPPKILQRRDRKSYLAVTVIVVVVQELTYPAGRLCDVILWPPGPTVVTLVVNPALLQIDWARFSRAPIKLGTVHCEIGVGVGVAAGVGVGVAVGVDVGLGVGVGV
jgi:hypothetical protein